MRRLLSSTALAAAALALTACAATVVVTGGAGGAGAATSSTSAGTGAGGSHITHVDKIDLLLMVDNSASMADKQQVLGTALPDLMGGLLNPPCVDAAGQPIASIEQPSTPTAACPTGATRLYPPVLDVHVGLVSSSLGSFGANGCPDIENTCPGNMPNPSANDHGHLLTRTDPCATSVVPTYKSERFLAWDPAQALTPPGTGDLPTLETRLNDLVVGAGQSGCGFESQNEAWYRFLVDPSPYAAISLDAGGTVITSGTDAILLKERQAFLRSDSLLMIVVVTDETDTSIKESGQFPLFAQETTATGQPFHLPRARQECTDPQKGPTDACCASCGSPTPPGCPTDPTCTEEPLYTSFNENLGLRAFGLSGGLMSHKARYGIEFFYQPSRYVNALSSPTVEDAAGKMVPNPIFSINPNDPSAFVRDPSLVYYATITGVPWQLIARQDANGKPDLLAGVDPLDATVQGGFKSSEELGADGRARPHLLGRHRRRSGELRAPDLALHAGVDRPPHGHRSHHRHRDHAPGLAERAEPDQRERVDHPDPRAGHRVRVHLPPRDPDRLHRDAALRLRRLRRERGQPALLPQPERQHEPDAPEPGEGIPGPEEPRDRQGPGRAGHRRIDLRRAGHRPDEGRLRLPPGDEHDRRARQRRRLTPQP